MVLPWKRSYYCDAAGQMSACHRDDWSPGPMRRRRVGGQQPEMRLVIGRDTFSPHPHFTPCPPPPLFISCCLSGAAFTLERRPKTESRKAIATLAALVRPGR